jgi:hypothetical protein
MPVDHLSVVRNQFLGCAVFSQCSFVVFMLDCQITGIHMVVGALQLHQPAQLS